jgi:isoquinoline 1-oxidoreductase beta subunit
MKSERFSGFDALPSQTRRTFLKASVTAGGALLLGFRLKSGEGAAGTAAAFSPDAFIRIDRDGTVTLIMPQVEMGQGTYTSISAILAEELDAKWDQVKVDHAPPSDALYGNPTFKEQMTGNSNSVRAFWMPLRKTAAAARAMLVEAAAKRWKVDASTCTTGDSEVIHAASNRKLAYADLIADASRVEAPQDPPLKAVKDFKLIGKPLKRLDTPDKTNGKAMYGIDAMPQGLKFATLRACPVFGGKVAHVDDAKAKQVPGVRQVVVLDDLVAVVGDHMWAAKQGLDALDITWNEGEHANVTTDAVWTKIRAASEKEGLVAKSEGDFAKGIAEGEKLDFAYEMPFLAHATMEPLNCTVHVTPDSCEVWVGSQVLARAQKAAAHATGLPLEKVIVHNHLIGGGFGRRLDTDYVDQAVRLAQ